MMQNDNYQKIKSGSKFWFFIFSLVAQYKWLLWIIKIFSVENEMQMVDKNNENIIAIAIKNNNAKFVEQILSDNTIHYYKKLESFMKQDNIWDNIETVKNFV